MKNDLRLQKIFLVWDKLQTHDIEEIENELKEINIICTHCRKIVKTSLNQYTNIYDLLCKENINKLPILTSFFNDLETFSKEAYDFLTEGYDMANLIDYLRLENKDTSEIFDIIIGITEYSIYMRHAILKICKEKSVAKRRMMIRGLVGM